jgi:hypothetical protein
MIHRDTACLVVVDRSIDPIVHLDYGIPFSDTCVGPLEPEASRTHQYVALCRTPEPWESLPHWLVADDVEASLAAGVLRGEELPAEDEIMDASSQWSDCHVAVTTERRPIHCTAAGQGVDWDTRDVEAGVWVLAGYTYHPPLNQWVPRTGAFKIVDGVPGPPAVGLYPPPPYAGGEDPLDLVACVDAEPGSTVHVSAAPAGPDPAPWIELDAIAVEDAGEVAFSVDLSMAFTEAASVAVRVEVRDPKGSSFVYVAPETIAYRPGPTPSLPPPPPEYDYCDEPSALEPQKCPDASTGTGDDGGTQDGPGGCHGCRTGVPSWVALLWLPFRGRRTRRRDLRCKHDDTMRTSPEFRDRWGRAFRRGVARSSSGPRPSVHRRDVA